MNTHAQANTAPDVIARFVIGLEACTDEIGAVCIATRGNGFGVFVNGGELPQGERERFFPATDPYCLMKAYTFALSIIQELITDELQMDGFDARYLFADDESNTARLVELRDILAEDPELASISDASEFRAELAALETHAARRAVSASSSLAAGADIRVSEQQSVPNPHHSDDTGSPPAMTFDEFRATGRDVEDLREIDGYGDGLDDETAGRVYQGEICIERSVPPRTGWHLTLNHDGCHSDDLMALERRLYQFALSEEIISRPPIEDTTRRRWVTSLETAITTLLEMGGYDVDIEHLRGAVAEAKGQR